MQIDRFFMKSLWSLHNIGWTTLEALGSSGGILIMLNGPSFIVLEITKVVFSLSILMLGLHNESLYKEGQKGECALKLVM